MNNRSLLLLLLAFCPLFSPAENMIFTNTRPIEVAGRGLPPPRSGGWDTTSRFEAIPYATTRSQGSHSVQSDVSVRGGPFNTSGLLLGGMPLRNPQTEHFQGDLDLPGDYFEPPQVATGLERFSRSSGHPSGAVVLELAPIYSTGRLAAGAGGAGQRSLNIQQGLAAPLQATDLRLSVFAGLDEIDRTDRQPDNNLRRWSTGGRAQLVLDGGTVDLLLANSRREFGARGFYGTPRELPSAEEIDHSLALLEYRHGDHDERDYERITAGLNRLHDTYWYRGRHQPPVNEHRSMNYALNGALSRPLSRRLSLLMRGDLNHERIESGALGDHDRTAFSLAALPTWQDGRVEITAGGAVELFSGDKPGWLPAAGINWHMREEQSIFVNYSEAIRLPSYTEYNYNNPTSLGNRGLDRQHTRMIEAGWRGARPGLQAETTTFAELGDNSVDWILVHPEATTFTAANLDSPRRYGVTCALAAKVCRNFYLSLTGLSQTQDCDSEYYASRYLMDYMQHELKGEIGWQASRGVSFRLWQRLQQMERNPLRQSSRRHRLAGGEVRMQTAAPGRPVLTLGVANLLDDDFEVFVGQPEAGRRFYVAAECNW